jgi:hypothetical protein
MSWEDDYETAPGVDTSNNDYQDVDLGAYADANNDGWETWSDPLSSGGAAAGWVTEVTTDGKWDLAKLAAKGLTLAGAIQAFQQAQNPPKTGYQGGIPSLTGVRAQTAPAAPNTRPGAGGHRYFSDLQYTNNANAEDPVSGLAAIKTLATNQATDLNAANQWRASQQAAAQPAAQTPAQVKAAQDAFYGRTTPAAPAAQAPLTLATNTPNMTPQQKAMYYNNLIGRGYSDADIRTAAGPQTDENWNALKGLATNPPAAPVAFTPEKQYVTPAGVAIPFQPEKPYRPLARGGSTNPRYLQGNTDGMADKIPARIDGKQEAALAHGEFVVPADVVSHLGNGNSDAGADVLYKMMDKIRHARTGTKKQGKQINPEKFTAAAGGLAYAAGGKVLGFAGPAGSTVPSGVVGTESNLSNWVGPYVTDMLGKGQALSTMPYQAYQGPLSAGDSSLQTQAYGLAGGLQTPAGIGQAAATAGQVATNAGGLNYQPTGATNQFTAPGQYSAAQNTSAFNQPGQYTASQNTSAFATPASTGYTATDTGKTTAASAPNAVGGSYTAANANASGATAAQSDYNPAAGLQNYQMGPASNVGSQQFTDPGVAASYMNPYLKQSLDPQLQEARRQSQISQQATNAQATQAGAFGGSRSAILGAENQRNLGSNLANITGQGYNTAYTTGQNQFNADQGRSLTAQQANQAAGMNVGSQNLQAKLGVQALGAQYGSQMALANLSNQQQANLQTSAQSQQTALANQQAANQAGQFGAAASNQAALANQQAANQMSQYNAGLGQAANLANQSAANQAAQFGAQQGMTAAQLQAQYGLSAQQANEMSRQFGANYGMQGAQTAAQYGLAAQNANEASRQFGAQYGMTGAQNTAQYGQQAQAQNAQENQFAANYGLQGLNTQLQAAQAQGNLGNMQNQAGLANLNTMAGLGATQQATQQAGIAADQAAFNQERDNPYKMVQYQQSLLQGLPLAAQQYNTSTNPYYAAAGAAADIGKTLDVTTPG